ncbi:hypothetical protein TOPH_03901 [Tolypocladium ophioglossoides CBS 100239]|uniref:Uncharacterized protein n=1 Tax=Tolypocladium ophioglossoides (strain CBS 100239) TaxID=1163406 RepID=A0A0L0NBK3_TOLOC|nr:hypothetical protein TOPH_03901 [Tolypocladium ophioglossoides CBS 100239]
MHSPLSLASSKGLWHKQAGMLTKNYICMPTKDEDDKQAAKPTKDDMINAWTSLSPDDDDLKHLGPYVAFEEIPAASHERTLVHDCEEAAFYDRDGNVLWTTQGRASCGRMKLRANVSVVIYKGKSNFV